jgi:NADH-quinone oxidoreductase subunit I
MTSQAAPRTPWTKPAVPGTPGTPVSRPVRTVGVQSYVPAWLEGSAVTMRHFFHNLKQRLLGDVADPVLNAHDPGIITIHYPEQRRAYPERFRGLHRLTTREDGSPRCVACLCCSTACPAQCISIEAGEYPEGDPRRGYERFPATFVIDELRCVFCGMCVEACPCDAIRMDTGVHPAAYDSRDQFIHDKPLLLGFPARDGSHQTANPRIEPGEPGHPGVERERRL